MKFKKQEKIKTAVIINAISKYIKVIINLLFTAILARILSAEDYGIVAVVTVFTTFFLLFSDMGLAAAVVQNKNLENFEINEIYSFTIFLGIGLAVIFALFSFPLASFYNNKIYIPIAMLLSISLLFNAFNTVPNAILMKNKQFMLVAIRTIVITLTSGIICVILALYGFKYYSIVTESIIISVATYTWNMATVKLKFTFKIKKTSLKKVWNFSMYQFAFNFVNYFSRNLDNLLTGKLMGNVNLGYYDKAYKLMQYPTSNLTHVISPVLHPILSDYQNDKNYIYNKYLIVVKFLMILGIFISAFCYIASYEIIIIIYEKNWTSSVACFTGLSISIWAQMVSSSTGAIFQSLGKTQDMFIAGTINAVINILAIIAGVASMDIVTLAFYIGISYNIHFFTNYIILIKFSFKNSFLLFIKDLWKEFFIGLLLVIAIIFYPFSYKHIFLSFLLKFLYLGLIFTIGLITTKEYKFLLRLLKK